MPRPTRIEYPGAFYHVMNRGRGRQNIFHGIGYFRSFLDCLSESHQKFGAIFHAYCLMNNHYHLILETPYGNLSRVMRHINGIYTQRYNRLRKTDGPLFRGRFKAILVDEDDYLLNLNRYIHRNPINLVEKLEDYKWSSYPIYLNKFPIPKWMNKSRTLEMISNNPKSYKSYVEGIDEDNSFMEDFYSKKSIPAVMGGEDFKRRLYEEIVDLNYKNQNHIKDKLNDHITMERIIKAVSRAFEVEEEIILNRQSGKTKNNFPRRLTMYLCQIYNQDTLSNIKNIFNLKSVGSVGNAIYSVKKELENNQYEKELCLIKELLHVVQ